MIDYESHQPNKNHTAMKKTFVWREGLAPVNLFLSWGNDQIGWGFYIYLFGYRLSWFKK